MKRKCLIASIGILFFLWIMQMPKVDRPSEGENDHPVRVHAREIEEEVYGVDPETEFVPGVQIGGLIELKDHAKKISPEDEYYKTLEMMAKCVEAEAGNQGLLGKRLVVDVILNRVKDPDFPDTIREVIAQPYHFSVYWNGAMEAAEPTEETWTAIHMEIKKVSYPGVLYFTSEDYLQYGTPWEKIGDHYFSTK